MNLNKNPKIFGIIFLETISGLIFGLMSGYVYSLFDKADITHSVLNTFLIVYLFILVGIGLVGYFYLKSINKHSNFEKSIAFSAIGLILFLILYIVVNSLTFKILPHYITSVILPIILPLFGALLGFNISIIKRKNNIQGEDLLRRLIGCKLEAGMVQSFYLEGKLEDKINVTYLKFDNWIKIVSIDDLTTIKVEKNNIVKNRTYSDEKITYSLESIENCYPEFKKYIGTKLIGYKELVLEKDKSLSYGVNFYFENNLNFVIHNQDYPVEKNEYYFENYIPKDLIEK